MSDRERWTVYPLLFLTLGIAVKDKMIKLVNVDTVLCNKLVVHDRKGNEQLIASQTPSGGLLRLNGTRPGLNLWVGHTEKLAGLFFVDGSGHVTLGPAVIPTVMPRQPARSDSARPESEAPSDDAADRPGAESRPQVPADAPPEQSTPDEAR